MKNYLIGIKNGRHLAGNDGTLITSYKAMYKLKELAEMMKAKRLIKSDEVYLVSNYTQKMCEMNNDTFVNYVRKNGTRLA